MKKILVSKLKVQDYAYPHEWVDVDRSADPPFLKSFVDSIKKHGILSPILVTTDMRVRDGRTRAIAAHKAGLKKIAAVVIDDEKLWKELVKRNKKA